MNIVMTVSEVIRPPSRAAVLTAVARALCSQPSGPGIFADDLAIRLAGEEGRRLGERLRREIPRRHLGAFVRWVCIRSRFTEDLVERAVARGVGQCVILGAGLDSFAYRRVDLVHRICVFEVDHPASQAWKRGRLAELGVKVPDDLIYASVDFEHQSLRERLGSAGFDFQRPALVSWIGVTMYLTLDAINSTLATVAECAPATQIVLTYNQPRHSLDHFARQVTGAVASIAAEMGEPFVRLFLPDEIEGVPQTHAFADIAQFGPQEARASYYNGNADVEIAGAQRLVVATVMAPATID
jgi:methyltransferase (TIGR00027 family)